MSDIARHMVIKHGNTTRRFTEHELDELDHMQKMMDAGYQLNMVSGFRGQRIMAWVKNDNPNADKSV